MIWKEVKYTYEEILRYTKQKMGVICINHIGNLPVFHNNEGLKNLLHPLSDSAASHLLNTALIGFFDIITGILYILYKDRKQI